MTTHPHTNIPAELRGRPQWVAWRLEAPPGSERVQKMPIDPKTGRHADTTRPATWGTFEQAVAYAQRPGHNGIGYVFSPNDPYTGIDLDHCRNAETGVIEP